MQPQVAEADDGQMSFDLFSMPAPAQEEPSHRCFVVGDGDGNLDIIGPVRKGAHGVGLSVNGNNSHVMVGPQFFHR